MHFLIVENCRKFVGQMKKNLQSEVLFLLLSFNNLFSDSWNERCIEILKKYEFESI